MGHQTFRVSTSLATTLCDATAAPACGSDGMVVLFASSWQLPNFLALMCCLSLPNSCFTPTTVQIWPYVTHTGAPVRFLTSARRPYRYMAPALGLRRRRAMLRPAGSSSDGDSDDSEGPPVFRRAHVDAEAGLTTSGVSSNDEAPPPRGLC